MRNLTMSRQSPRRNALVFVEEKPVTGRVLPIEEGITIGREGDVMLPDPEVSRRHAVVGELDSAPTIEDLGSKNGTFLNGKLISAPTKLEAGDTIRFGNTVWRVESSGSATRVSQRGGGTA
jgi:pSer/pThr/pTyr-binding forkhead associated (FHA) protein